MFIKNLYRIKKVLKETEFVTTSVPVLYSRILKLFIYGTGDCSLLEFSTKLSVADSMISFSNYDFAFDEKPWTFKMRYFESFIKQVSLIYNVKCTMIKIGISESIVKKDIQTGSTSRDTAYNLPRISVTFILFQ